MTRKVDLRGASRRDFVQYVLTTSAALGLGPTRALEILDQLGGSALAQAVSAQFRTVNVVAGTGAQAWFTLLWPVPGVIKNFNAAFAWDTPSLANAYKVNDPLLEGRDLYVRSVAGKPLWQTFGKRKLVTALVCGNSSAHASDPTNTNVLPDGTSGPIGVYAGSASIQSTLKALVPVIGIKANNNARDMPYGTAPGAPAQSSVANANAMIGLFSSAASRLQQRLSTRSPSMNPDLYALYHKAFLGLTRTAGVPTFSRALNDSRVAVDLLAKNLGSKLAPTPTDIAKWCGGVSPATGNVDDFARSMFVTAKAFELGLTAQVNMPFGNDDPHTALAANNLVTTTKVADQLASILENFLQYLSGVNDPVNKSMKLSDAVVMTFSGDTPKEPYVASGWPDSTPGGSNWIYVMSQGRVKPGWFGNVKSNNTKENWDPATGLIIPGTPTATTNKNCIDGAMSGILYAVSNGDDRRVRDFSTAVNYNGIVNPLVVN